MATTTPEHADRTPIVAEPAPKVTAGFSPAQEDAYKSMSASGSKTGSSDTLDFNAALASGVAFAGNLATNGLYGAVTNPAFVGAVADMINGVSIGDESKKEAATRMLDNGAGLSGVRASLENLRGSVGDDTTGGVEDKNESGYNEVIRRFAETIQRLDPKEVGKIATTLIDWGKMRKPPESETSKESTEIPDGLGGTRPEVAKRAKFEDAMQDMAEDFPDSFRDSQELFKAAFKMAQTGDFNPEQVKELAQRAAKEFAENPNGEAAQRFRAISEQLRDDYGVNIDIGRKGLEIRNNAEGENASLLLIDQNGKVTAKTNINGSDPHTVNAKVALANIAQTRREHAFDTGRRENPGRVLEPAGGKITKPRGPVYSEKENRDRPHGPIKVYADGYGEAYRSASEKEMPAVIKIGR